MARKANKQNRSLLMAIIGGALTALAVTIGVAVVTTVLIAGEKMEIEHAGYGSGLALLLGGFLGALTAAGRVEQKRMVASLASGVAYLAILLSVTALIFDGIYTGVGVSVLLILGASAAAGLLGLKKSGLKGRKKIRF